MRRTVVDNTVPVHHFHVLHKLVPILISVSLHLLRKKKQRHINKQNIGLTWIGKTSYI